MPVDQAALSARMRSAVAEVLGKQAEAGLADAMRHEYETVAQAGLVLQMDCLDLAMGRHIQFTGRSIEEFRNMACLHLEALNLPWPIFRPT